MRFLDIFSIINLSAACGEGENDSDPGLIVIYGGHVGVHEARQIQERRAVQGELIFETLEKRPFV
jgi:hypothetical protein